MDFSYTDEQRMLSESLEKLFAGYSGDTSGARDRATQDRLWQDCAQTGLIGLTVPEDSGGLSGGAVDVMVAAIDIGRNNVQLPFLSTAVAGAGALRLAGSAQQQEDYLAPLAEGALKVACAFGEAGARYDLADVDTRAERDGDHFVLRGEKVVVLGGDTADLLVVSARAPSEERYATKGITLFLVDAQAEGITRNTYELADGRGGADIRFDNLRLPETAILGELGAGYDVMEAVTDLAAAAICAEGLGAMEQVIALTKEYLETRQQFGKPIGAFQSLQHVFADMVVDYEHIKSLVYEAAAMADSGDVVTRQQAISAAKVVLSQDGRRICQQAIQIHGGIGVTQEFELGDYVKRITVAEFAFGDADHHIARYGGHMADRVAGGDANRD